MVQHKLEASSDSSSGLLSVEVKAKSIVNAVKSITELKVFG